MSRFTATTATTPAAFSYTPTGRAVAASVPLRTPAPRTLAPSCTPTGRIVAAASAREVAA